MTVIEELVREHVPENMYSDITIHGSRNIEVTIYYPVSQQPAPNVTVERLYPVVLFDGVRQVSSILSDHEVFNNGEHVIKRLVKELRESTNVINGDCELDGYCHLVIRDKILYLNYSEIKCECPFEMFDQLAYALAGVFKS